MVELHSVLEEISFVGHVFVFADAAEVLRLVSALTLTHVAQLGSVFLPARNLFLETDCGVFGVTF